jgi:hypothetical protein
MVLAKLKESPPRFGFERGLVQAAWPLGRLLRFFTEPFLGGRVVRLFEGTRTITPAPPQLHSNH